MDKQAPELSTSERAIINASRTQARAAFMVGAHLATEKALGRHVALKDPCLAAYRNKSWDLYPELEG